MMQDSDTETDVAPRLHLSPPPPPPIDPRPTRLQQHLLLALFALGVALLLLGFTLSLPQAALFQHGGFFLCCYVAVVSASWLRDGVLSRRVDRFLDRWVKNGGRGFYGMMALSLYVHLELETLLESVTGFELAGDWWRDLLIESLIGFSIESLKNFVAAMAWPATVLTVRGGGLSALLLVAGCWGIYELGRRVLPQGSVREHARPR